MGYFDLGKTQHEGFEVLKGLTLTSVEVDTEEDTITFHTDSGRKFIMCHIQDCCESVWIDDIIGSFDSLLGEPLMVAEESTSYGDEDDRDEYMDDSETWTFYKLANVGGWVDIRWYGCSNGYYSESVDFMEILE